MAKDTAEALKMKRGREEQDKLDAQELTKDNQDRRTQADQQIDQTDRDAGNLIKFDDYKINADKAVAANTLKLKKCATTPGAEARILKLVYNGEFNELTVDSMKRWIQRKSWTQGDNKKQFFQKNLNKRTHQPTNLALINNLSFQVHEIYSVNTFGKRCKVYGSSTHLPCPGKEGEPAYDKCKCVGNTLQPFTWPDVEGTQERSRTHYLTFMPPRTEVRKAYYTTSTSTSTSTPTPLGAQTRIEFNNENQFKKIQWEHLYDPCFSVGTGACTIKENKLTCKCKEGDIWIGKVIWSALGPTGGNYNGYLKFIGCENEDTWKEFNLIPKQ